MSEAPEELFYTKEHEWLRIEGDEVVVGITDHAQDALTDIVYIELPEVGDEFTEMDEFALVESVKSASPIFAPMAGEILAVNQALEDTPELINQDPYGEGWIVRFKFVDSNATEGLMSADDYRVIIA
ncbi:MAG TPA: glycine cleavage system protein GcvH [Candidatus Poseidoniales archaeon]|nr:MAG: glycine cleavage system protein H [Euryarchaeota archaeon]HIA40159.1 glycine cleavage system protein GcvH [Candidatus Poseidoniales archaeon]PXY75524.1 MAG: glycine cleavage system protein H [Euryarchaeota archaeon]PXY77271.1 MAG: glycine cleavage system protein H [Euryarchaeota archaeon]HIA90017.1 glycine cleavage system protein GcvH [Candidatus Poseidoniales archaeon]